MHKIKHLGQFRTRCIICRWQILRDRISTCVYFHQFQKMCWSWYFVQNYLGFNPGADSHFGTWFQVLHSAFGSSSDDPYTATLVLLQSTTVDRRKLLPHSSLSSWPKGSVFAGRKEGRKGVRRPREQFRLFPSQYVNCRLLRGIIWSAAPSL